MADPASLRQDALACLRAAIAAVEPERLTLQALESGQATPAAAPAVRLAALGKAAPAMARGARQALGERLRSGLLVIPRHQGAASLPGFDTREAGHPVPDEGSLAAGAALRELASDLGPDELLLCLISGGGSALMTLPVAGVSLADLQRATDLLLRAGATIHQLNAVRKHLEQLKGGRLAELASPAPILALVLSDVVGDPLDVIASGPVSPDPTTFADAVEMLERLGVWQELPPSVRRHLERGVRGEAPETPKPGDPCFAAVDVRIIGNNRLAAEGALAAAAARGYATHLLTTTQTGEAREVGRELARRALEVQRTGRPLAPPACLVAAGETTVTVRGAGRGGRNQEVALGAAAVLDGSRGVLVASLGTDGIDGPTDAAGAIATGRTLARARRLGLEAERALTENDAYPFFQALDDLIVTGPTGTNVMDIQLVLVGR